MGEQEVNFNKNARRASNAAALILASHLLISTPTAFAEGPDKLQNPPGTKVTEESAVSILLKEPGLNKVRLYDVETNTIIEAQRYGNVLLSTSYNVDVLVGQPFTAKGQLHNVGLSEIQNLVFTNFFKGSDPNNWGSPYVECYPQILNNCNSDNTQGILNFPSIPAGSSVPFEIKGIVLESAPLNVFLPVFYIIRYDGYIPPSVNSGWSVRAHIPYEIFLPTVVKEKSTSNLKINLQFVIGGVLLTALNLIHTLSNKNYFVYLSENRRRKRTVRPKYN